TIDSGYKNTGATQSAITYLDGEQGILHYRGYSIDQLAAKSNFIEVAYLLIYGELPTQPELTHFNDMVAQRTLVHENFRTLLSAYPANAHPMGILASMICSLTAFHPDSLEPNLTAEQVDLNIARLMGKITTIAAWSYKHSVGQPLVYPKK